MSKDFHLVELEKSACKFIQELGNISIETTILHKSEVKKANMLIYCVRAVMDSVGKKIKEVEENTQHKKI